MTPADAGGISASVIIAGVGLVAGLVGGWIGAWMGLNVQVAVLKERLTILHQENDKLRTRFHDYGGKQREHGVRIEHLEEEVREIRAGVMPNVR